MSTKAPREHRPEAYRKQLHVLIERVSGGVEQLAAESLRPVGAEGTSADAPAHDPTAAGNEGDGEVARTVLLSEAQILDEARAALARLDAGEFGKCERCGRAITQARLEAIPYARNCIKCARAAETAPVS